MSKVLFKNEEYMDVVLDAQEDFEREIMPRTRKAIREMIAEADPEFVRTCRIEYLKGLMEDTVTEAFCLLGDYEDTIRRDCPSINRLYVGNRFQELVRQIVKLQGEIISLRRPEGKYRISREMIRRAKERPFADLMEFKRNVARCPFHEDRTPSMYLYEKDNRVYCFSCRRNLDTISFVMERDGLRFIEAVNFLI